LITECTRELFEDATLKGFAESKAVALAADWRNEVDVWGWVEGKEESL